jgi:hypothetical protein
LDPWLPILMLVPNVYFSSFILPPSSFLPRFILPSFLLGPALAVIILR